MDEFFSRNMLSFLCSLRFLLSNFFIFLFRPIFRHILRIQADYETRKDKTSMAIFTQIFEFVEEKVDDKKKLEAETVSVSVSASNSSKYQLVPSFEIHEFVEDSESQTVEEFYVSTDDSSSSGNQTPHIGKYLLWEFSSELEETDDEAKIEDFIESFSSQEISSISLESNDQILEESRIIEKQNQYSKPCEENKILDGFESFPEVQVLGEGDYSFSSSDSDSESTSSENAPISSGILDDIDESGGMEIETFVAMEDEKEEICFSDDMDSKKVVDHIENKFYISEDEEYIELELNLPLTAVSYAKVLPIKDFTDDGYEMENSIQGKTENEDSCGNQERELKFDEDDDEDETEFVQEHQDLIEQLKMELRNARTGGLATILEDEETEPESDLVQSLKPMKTDGQFEYKQQLKEIQKVYLIYAQKMRKLDVLNSQTMHAIGFLKLKDPVSPIAGRKSPIRVVKSLLSQNLWSRKSQKPSADASPRFIRDLNRDLEVVYVGHLCLSWELLHWQHRKAMQLQENDSEGTHQYNQVVNNFQLFCVLVQRFIEDERFRGPRIENYVKNRYVIRSLLQVPAIREDCSKDKRVRLREDDNTIPIGALVQIIEDSMRIFREFLRTDKDIENSIVKGAQQLHQTEIQSPAAAQLMMMEIRAALQKKEKRLKDILRSGNCIVKKFQRNEEARLKNSMLIAQIELKLVSRVLRMSKITENQLIWCHKKLHQVNFVNRKVVIEPSFLLFPC